MKKIITIALALGMALCLCACSASASVTTTTTTTTTDADGNTTTTTETTTTGVYPEGSCGAAAGDGEDHEITISILNSTGEDLTGLYVCPTGETKWSNLFGDGEYLGAGGTAEDYLTLTYNANQLSFDFGIGDENGEIVEFPSTDISTVDANGFVLEFTKEDGTFGWHIAAEYCK